MAANYDRDYGQNNGSLEQGGGNSSSRDIVSGSSSGFVNRGLQRWEESRAQWLASCAANKLEKRPQPKDVDIDQVNLMNCLIPTSRLQNYTQCSHWLEFPLSVSEYPPLCIEHYLAHLLGSVIMPSFIRWLSGSFHRTRTENCRMPSRCRSWLTSWPTYGKVSEEQRFVFCSL